MSRSIKKAIYKDGTGIEHRRMRKIVRRSQKNFMRTNLEQIATGDKIIPDQKLIVNDWDYSDYKIDYENRRDSWWSKGESDESFNERKKKFTRK
jgi:hypothetical protein